MVVMKMIMTRRIMMKRRMTNILLPGIMITMNTMTRMRMTMTKRMMGMAGLIPVMRRRKTRMKMITGMAAGIGMRASMKTGGEVMAEAAGKSMTGAAVGGSPGTGEGLLRWIGAM